MRFIKSSEGLCEIDVENRPCRPVAPRDGDRHGDFDRSARRQGEACTRLQIDGSPLQAVDRETEARGLEAVEPAKNDLAGDARGKLITRFHVPNELVSEIDVDFLILGTETVTDLTRHIAAHGPQRAADFDEDIEVVLSFADGYDLGVVDELPGRKLDRSSHGENEWIANEVVSGLDPEIERGRLFRP